MVFLLNKYPNKCIDEQFNIAWSRSNNHERIDCNNYDKLRQRITQLPGKGKVSIDYHKYMFIHFTYCLSMKQFLRQFHMLWKKYFAVSPISDAIPILGTKGSKNPQPKLIYTRKF